MAAHWYAVCLDEGDVGGDEVERRLAKHYSCHRHSDSLILVSSDSDFANRIAKNAGIKGDGRDVSGVVFRLYGTYAGHTYKSLWDWLKDTKD